MYSKIKNLAACLCAVASLTACHNSNNAENIIGKWQGTYSETCGNTSVLSAVEIEFTEAKTFTAKIKPANEPAALTSGTYAVERYKLIFISSNKERNEQKIVKLSADTFKGNYGSGNCKGITVLKKMGS